MPDLLELVLAAADRHGDRPALTDHRGRTMSYRDLGSAVRNTAESLGRLGFLPGDRMLFSVRPDPAGIVLALGTVAAGGAVVFMDPGVGADLFAARVAVADARWAAAESLLYAASAPGPLRAIARRRGLLLPRYGSLPLHHLRSGPWLPGVPLQSRSVRRLARDGSGAELLSPDPDQPAVVIFTSGSTGDPKAVVHSRGSLGAALAAMTTRYQLLPAHRVLTDQLMLGLPALAAGAHWTVPPFGFAPRVDPAAFAQRLAGATHTFLVPADLAAVLAEFERIGPPEHLQQILVGAAPVLPPLLRRAAAVLPGVEVLAVYGMTEILPVSIADAAQKLGHDGPGDHLGTLLPGVSARTEEDGQLVVSGENMCRGYLTADGLQPTAEVATGDLARIEGRDLVLLGRSKDMIIRGDKNIYPGLYEPAVTALPGVAEAVMIGVPNEIGDEAVVLVVVPDTPSAGRSAAEASRLLPDDPLADRVTAALPGLIDISAQPDLVLVASAIPASGRTSKPDRAALAALVIRAHPDPRR